MCGEYLEDHAHHLRSANMQCERTWKGTYSSGRVQVRSIFGNTAEGRWDCQNLLLRESVSLSPVRDSSWRSSAVSYVS